MCTVVILCRPDHEWPILMAANRDEMENRPWAPPARHWADRPEVRAGVDQLAGGTWLALSDQPVVAGVLNRMGTLGPAAGFRSRGELPLEAVDHAEASVAAEALSHLDPTAYRPFNMVVADRMGGYWLRNDGADMVAEALPEGISIITAHDLNDLKSPRIAHYLPRFQAAADPNPDTGDWAAWQALMSDRRGTGDPHGAMQVETDIGFRTVCSSLIALPANPEKKPIWLFAAGAPDAVPFLAVDP
ncbi:MAG: NRDE family protein [Magnetospiraceae bacterium]